MNRKSLRTDDDIDNVLSKYADMVYKIALSQTRSSANAEDIFQEVFLRYVQADTKFESEEHRKAWLIRVNDNKDQRVDFYNTWSFVYTSGAEENAKSMTVNINPSSIPYWSALRAYQLQGDSVQPADIDKLLELGKKSEVNGTEVTI